MGGQKKIGFIGAGTMAKAIIKGVVASGFAAADNIIASEISEETATKASEVLGIKVITSNTEVVRQSDVIILCVKPYVVAPVLKEISNDLQKGKLLVSIAAGVATETIENAIGKEISVVRGMPNTPALVGEGMSSVCKGKYASDEDIAFVMNLLKAVGRCVEVEEKFMNAVTGISGSGPAFMYLIIEAMADGGVKLGLKKDIAVQLAAQTMIGAAKMVLETGKHPAMLKDEVTTPGGCTIAGLEVMEEENVRSAMIKTVKETAKVAAGLG